MVYIGIACAVYAVFLTARAIDAGRNGKPGVSVARIIVASAFACLAYWNFTQWH